MLEKNKTSELTLPYENKTHYKTLIIKTISYWHRLDKMIHRTENPEIDSDIHDHLIYGKRATTIHWKEKIVSKNLCWKFVWGRRGVNLDS